MTENENSDKQILGFIKTGLFLLCIVFAVAMVVTPIIGSYNALVDSDLQVSRSAANIRTDLERRADLLPNLAETLKGSAKFEHDTFVDLAAARSGSIKQNIKSASTIEELNVQDVQLTELYGNFVKLQEQYPDLKTTGQFREFSAQVTATENQILMDRQTYNAAVMQYQGVCRSFPTNVMAGMFGFSPDKHQMYMPKDLARAEAVPTITFSDMAL